MRKYILLSLSILLLSNLPGFAGQVSLEDAVKLGLQDNHELQAIKNALSATEREIGIARSNLMPKVKFDESFISTNNPAQVFALKLNQTRLTSQDFAGAPDSFNDPGSITNFLTAISLDQPIFDRKSNIEIAMAKKEYSAQGYEYLRKQEELAAKIAQTYLMVSTAQEFVKVAQQGLYDAKEHLRIAQVRYKNELGLYSDVLRSQTAVIEAEQNLVSAHKYVNVSKRGLGLLLGKQESVDISDAVPEISLKNSDYYSRLSIWRNDIKAMEIKVENAKNNIKLAESDIYPTIGAGASYQLYDHRAPFALGGHNYIAGASLKWDIFDGNKTKYEKLKAKDKVAEAQQHLESLKKSVLYKVYESYSSVEEALKNLELANSAVKSAEEGKRLVLKRWGNSLSPFVDLMDAQTNLARARANVIKSRNDYKSALIKLSLESGLLPDYLSFQPEGTKSGKVPKN